MKRSMSILGSKWKPILIYSLRERNARFGQLAAIVGTISRKVLAATLKEMEAEGLVTREEHAEPPLRVEYSLTERGRELLPIMESLSAWDLKYYTLEDAERVKSYKTTARQRRKAA